MTTSPSSIPLSGMFYFYRRCRKTVSTNFMSAVAIGLPAYGHHQGSPAKNKAVPLELVSLHARTLFAITDALFKTPVSLCQHPGGLMFNSWLMDVRLFQTGKSNHTSDTRRTRHDIHACPTSRSSHSPPLPPPFYRMPVPCHNALAQANEVMKFKPLYSLVHNPPRLRIIIEHSLPLRSSQCWTFVSYN